MIHWRAECYITNVIEMLFRIERILPCAPMLVVIPPDDPNVIDLRSLSMVVDPILRRCMLVPPPVMRSADRWIGHARYAIGKG